jgi:glutamine cyclotransferase
VNSLVHSHEYEEAWGWQSPPFKQGLVRQGGTFLISSGVVGFSNIMGNVFGSSTIVSWLGFAVIPSVDATSVTNCVVVEIVACVVDIGVVTISRFSVVE